MIPAMDGRALWKDVVRFPWRDAVLVLIARFREDRLSLAAGGLTFTTTIALVPFVTVALALLTVFPMFATLQERLQRWLVASLIPDTISRQVLGYLTQFAGAASELGAAGLMVLLGSALALVLTIDRTLNHLWRVRRRRPLAQRVLIYWTTLTLGPLVLAASLNTTSYVFSASRHVVGASPVLRLVFDTFEFLLLAGGMASLYRCVPNTHVRWSHAWAGGLFVAAAIEVAKRVLGYYWSLVPTYSVLYGAFATAPILLVWIYVAWALVLSGAVVTASLPGLLAGVARREGEGAGWAFQLAVEALQQLRRSRGTPAHGLGAARLAERLRVDTLQLAPVLEVLVALDWVAPLAEEAADEDPRYVLLAGPDTPLEPLLQVLLLPCAAPLEKIWQKGPLRTLRLGDAL